MADEGLDNTRMDVLTSLPGVSCGGWESIEGVGSLGEGGDIP